MRCRHSRTPELAVLCLAAIAQLGCGSHCDNSGMASQASQQCLTNVKQDGLGLLMYSQDYDERFPPATAGWMDATVPYLKNNEDYQCPTVVATNPNGYGYAFNSAVAGSPLSSITAPATTLMIYDSSNLARNAVDALTSLPNPGRHSGLNNVCYADGHNGSLKP